MNPTRRVIAATQLLLIFPAALFMIALIVRSLQPMRDEPAHGAQQIVMWYAGRQWTLWVLLLALPFAALVTGCVALRSWNRDVEAPHNGWRMLPAQATLLFVAATTLTAGVILLVVVLHMAAN